MRHTEQQENKMSVIAMVCEHMKEGARDTKKEGATGKEKRNIITTIATLVVANPCLVSMANNLTTPLPVMLQAYHGHFQ